MALKKIFKRKKDITTLSTAERALFVEIFLKQNYIIPIDYGDINGEKHTNVIGTPQYTLTSYLDFFYVFVMNLDFRNTHIESASETSIDLHDFELNPVSMMKLGEYYTSFRNLSAPELEEVRRLWRGQIDEPNHNRVDTLEDAALYWSESIVRALQVFDLLELGRSQGILETEEYIKKIELNLSLNESLVAKYFDMRRSVK